jgi:hypothetical protein
MGVETEASELEHLQRRGKALGLHVERHRAAFDPVIHAGDLYIQERKAIYAFNGGVGNPPSLLHFATAEQVSAFLFERESK